MIIVAAKRLLLGLAAATALTVTACTSITSQAAGPPVDDNYVQGTRSAVADVVAAGGNAWHDGPECKSIDGDTGLQCSGSTTTGAPIGAKATGGSGDDLDAVNLVVTVGGKTIYTGSVGAVLTKQEE